MLLNIYYRFFRNIQIALFIWQDPNFFVQLLQIAVLYSVAVAFWTASSYGKSPFLMVVLLKKVYKEKISQPRKLFLTVEIFLDNATGLFSASRRTYQFFKNSGSSFIIFTGLLISTVPTTARAKEKNHNNIKNLQQNKIEKITTKTKTHSKTKKLTAKAKTEN